MKIISHQLNLLVSGAIGFQLQLAYLYRFLIALTVVNPLNYMGGCFVCIVIPKSKTAKTENILNFKKITNVWRYASLVFLLWCFIFLE